MEDWIAEPIYQIKYKKRKSRYNKAYLFVLFTSDRGLEKSESLLCLRSCAASVIVYYQFPKGSVLITPCVGALDGGVPMSHVEFKKWPCRRVEFSGPDPLC